MRSRPTIVVFDDDPTGSQTVHGCPLLLSWEQPALAEALGAPEALLFLLTDTRALAPEQVAPRLRQVCRALAAARGEVGLEHWLLVSRGDSTLRGHFPLEVEAIAAELGPFDGTLLVPAFLEGGRTTVDGVHLLYGEPVHTTPFGQDRLFGFRSSALPEWVEEKTAGRVPAAAVRRIGRAELAAAAAGPTGARALADTLQGLRGNPFVVADAERPEQLEALATAVWAAQAAGSRLLIQSAAGLIRALAALPPQPLDAAGLVALRRGPAPGAVLVGSHVPLADLQLSALLAEPGCGGVELPVERVLSHLRQGRPLEDGFEAELLDAIAALRRQGRTPVLFTSRGEASCADGAERRALGEALAGLMARIAAALPADLSYLISKGGITTQTLLGEGLAAAAVRLEGQLLPGLSLVRLPADHPRLPLLPLLTFPGNLGEAGTLAQAWRLMAFEEPETERPRPAGST
ncbi:four-carbon acid sugar kinase family protein [Cyanobium sp. Morenito 9A2]|uniref:four-carbon acid sugar kinase family protein n=1 Tax=Cyanobium sp. Morenito 9A2 TaxID=2823718 RepID=UPI0020CFA6FB|nr:four-carbon acid sugar kinase family protein [Cyanobium sp. Morenito 9A2]MCP9849537.1 four-carbon acid sugar kinase family protein [Cyanobium sp. Morenito 9A2]